MKTKKSYEMAVRRAEARNKRWKKKERERKKKEEQEGYHGNDSNQGYQGQKKKGSRARERRGPNDQYKKKTSTQER